LVLVGLVCLWPKGILLRGEEPLVQVDDSFVTADDDGRGWTIGNQLIHYSFGADGQTFGIRSIQDVVDGREWQRSSAPDTFVNINGLRVQIGSSATPFQRASATEWWGGVRLDVTYRHAASQMNITRSYACYPGSSVIETWTTFEVSGTKSVSLADLTDFSFSIPNGTLHWVSGLNSSQEGGGSFTKGEGDLDDGQIFEIGSSRRASEDNMPWFSVKVDGAEFFGSIMWAGSWRIKVQRQNDAIAAQVGLPTFATRVNGGGTLETPHAIFGFTNSSVPETSLALRNFIDKGLRHGRPYRPYVSYNTWYSYNTFVDEGSIENEMDMAAAIGAEQFVIDAGWWAGINGDDPGDFSQNLGNWQVDPDRFPNGLGVLADYAHARHMRFGIWVEPERVDLKVVGWEDTPKERFLATVAGRYDPEAPNGEARYGQICLADPEARQWTVDKLSAFIDEARPDYIKWDDNIWRNCDRAGHSHGTEDGNFAHHRGLQDVLQQLRDRYPDLDIENCSSGGSRLSLDMLQYSDVAWLSDQSDPSTRVRHNLEGLMGIFPPAYLLTFERTTGDEPVSDDRDLPLILRSRMGGSLGMSWFTRDMSEGTQAAISKEFSLYKVMRPILQSGSGFLLTDQILEMPDQPWAHWDVTEVVLPETGEAVLLAFDAPDSPETQRVWPKALKPDMDYDIESADYGVIGSAKGSELMSAGIELRASSISRGHVLLLRKHDSDVQRLRFNIQR